MSKPNNKNSSRKVLGGLILIITLIMCFAIFGSSGGRNAPPPAAARPTAEPSPFPTEEPPTVEPSPTATRPPTAVPISAPTRTPPPEGCVDINTASVDELKQIMHIDGERAAELVSLRPFASVESLTRINGIAEGRIKEILEQGVACVR